MTKDSQDFLEKKAILKIEEKLATLRHEFKMKELEAIRGNDKFYHERKLERGRIKSAEIRKAFERRENAEWIRRDQNRS